LLIGIKEKQVRQLIQLFGAGLTLDAVVGANEPAILKLVKEQPSEI
jgi:hypothetical protein